MKDVIIIGDKHKYLQSSLDIKNVEFISSIEELQHDETLKNKDFSQLKGIFVCFQHKDIKKGDVANAYHAIDQLIKINSSLDRNVPVATIVNDVIYDGISYSEVKQAQRSNLNLYPAPLFMDAKLSSEDYREEVLDFVNAHDICGHENPIIRKDISLKPITYGIAGLTIGPIAGLLLGLMGGPIGAAIGFACGLVGGPLVGAGIGSLVDKLNAKEESSKVTKDLRTIRNTKKDLFVDCLNTKMSHNKMAADLGESLSNEKSAESITAPEVKLTQQNVVNKAQEHADPTQDTTPVAFARI